MRSPRRSPPRTLAALLIASSTYSFSQSSLQPALPALRRDLATSAVGADAVFSAFFISGAISTALFGRLGDLLGRRRLLIAVLATFAAGSAICAMAPGILVLIAGRTVMGAAAAIFPLAFSIVRDELPAARVAGALGLLSGILGLGVAFGLMAGGALADSFGWRSISWLSALASGGALLVVVLFVPPAPGGPRHTLDLRGAVLLTGGISLPLVAISLTPAWGWLDVRSGALVAAGGVVLWLFARHELAHPDPLLDLRRVTGRTVAPTHLSALFVGLGAVGVTAVIAQFVQIPSGRGDGFGADATQAGLFLLPAALAMLATAAFSGRLIVLAGARAALLSGCAIAAVGLGLLSLLHRQRTELYAWPMLLMTGSGVAFAALPNLALAGSPRDRSGEATGVNLMLRQVGSGLGLQLAGVLVASRAGTEAGYVRAFALEGLGCAAAFACGLAIPRDRLRVTATGLSRE